MKKTLLVFFTAIACIPCKAQQILENVQVTDSANTANTTLHEPAAVSRLKEKELKRSTGLFLDDAINTNIPGVFMERRSISAGQQFNIRGYGSGTRGEKGINSNFDGQGYKVYLNNIPITDAEGITLMDDIDFASIGSVEMLKGPAGTLYGQAISGVINLETKKPESGLSIGENVLIGSYGLQRYTTQLQLNTEKSSLLINYGRQLYKGFMPHTSSHKDFVNIFGTVLPNSKQAINYYFGYSNSYDQRNGELSIQQYEELDYSGNPDYIKNDAHSNIISYRAGVSHTYQFCEAISNTTSVFGTGISNNSSSAGGWTDKSPLNYGFRTTFDIKLDITDKLKLSGITGMEAQAQNAQTIGYAMVPDSFNLSEYNIIGAIRSNQYTVNQTYSLFTEWTLSMPHDFQLTAGIGFSKMHIELNDRLYKASNNSSSGSSSPILANHEASYGNMFAPHIALNKVFNDKISVYASYSKGYKAPVSSYFFIPVTGQLNTGLKPEEGNQLELGSKGYLMKNRLYYQVAVFDALFSNKMTAVAVPNTDSTATAYTYVANGGKQDDKGLEASLSYMIPNAAHGFFKTMVPFVNFAWSDFDYKDFKFQQLSSDKEHIVESDYSGKKVAGVAPVTVNAGIDMVTKPGLYGNLTYSYRDGMYLTSDNKNKTAAYSLLNAKIGFEKDFTKHINIDLYFGSNNITGTQYFYMVFLNQLPDAYLPAPDKINFFGGINVKYIF